MMSAALAGRVADLERLLGDIARDHAPSALASSLSAEDMVVTDLILRIGLDIEIFTLDTGRLHADTLNLVGAIREHYGYDLQVIRPDAAAVAEFVTSFGRDAFYKSADLRKRCCAIRKVAPLGLALDGRRSWITGQRRSQAVTRAELPLREDDAPHGLTKFNPLACWSEDEVWAYIRAHEVPYNLLYDQGYRSIGCAPCTRPAVAGEDVRAGRWWWEETGARECGLHVSPDGRLVRTKEAVS
jgi:phosphoadenosine phosphosulfate reductase